MNLLWRSACLKREAAAHRTQIAQKQLCLIVHVWPDACVIRRQPEGRRHGRKPDDGHQPACGHSEERQAEELQPAGGHSSWDRPGGERRPSDGIIFKNVRIKSAGSQTDVKAREGRKGSNRAEQDKLIQILYFLNWFNDDESVEFL